MRQPRYIPLATAAVVAAFLLGACSSIDDAHAPPPECISEIDAERVEHRKRIKRVGIAHTVKESAAGGMVIGSIVGLLDPFVFFAGTALKAFDISTQKEQDREKFLAYARIHAEDC